MTIDAIHPARHPSLLLLPLSAMLACSTSAPHPGQSRRAYASYGVTRVDVVVVGLNTPGPATDEDMRLQLAPPPLLQPAEAIPGAASGSQRYSRLLGQALLAKLRERGFAPRIVSAEPTLLAQREHALDAHRHAVLLVRHLVFKEAWAGFRTRVQARTIDRGRIEDPLTVDVNAYIPMRYAGAYCYRPACSSSTPRRGSCSIEVHSLMSPQEIGFTPEPHLCAGDRCTRSPTRWRSTRKTR